MDKPKGMINLRVKDVGDFVQIELEDNGKGIAAKSNFCPYCGDAKTDKAVQMVMERWEELHG